MKALVIRQPWAGLILEGRKTIELRTWQTTYRGDFVLVAGKKVDTAAIPLRVDDFRAGALAIVRLAAVRPSVDADASASLSTPCGRFAWVIENVRPFAKPIAVLGQQRWFEIHDALLAQA